MKPSRLPLIVLTALALGNSAIADPQAAPAGVQDAAQAAAPRVPGIVATLSDAECLAVADYMRRIKRAAMQAWLDSSHGIGNGILQSIAELPSEGVPDDFRRYVAEYCSLAKAAMEKRNELSGKMNQGNTDDAWDVVNQINQLDKKLREDKLALSARYARASLMGGGWESNVYDSARTELHIMSDSARAYYETDPLDEGEKSDNGNRVAPYVEFLCAQPLPELDAATARRQLEHRELLKQLDPSWRLQARGEYYAVPEGTTYAVRLPYDASMGGTWSITGESTEGGAEYAVEWQKVPTESLNKPWPHGEGIQLANARPSTPETVVALVQLKKAGTAKMRFVCTREGEAEPFASKPITFHIRWEGDYRALMETTPLPRPEPAPIMEAGVASFTDEECLAIHRYLQMAYCYILEECAKAVEKQEHLQVPSISAGALPEYLLAPTVPRDVEDYLVEYHNTYIGIRAASRALDRKEYNYRYGKGITKEQRKEVRREREKIKEREQAMWKKLKEKYPRAYFLYNVRAPYIIEQVYRSYNRTDARARRFYGQNPDMKDASDKLSKAAFFRYLAAERTKEEQSVPAARRHLERLDSLRIMRANLGSSPVHHIYGVEGEDKDAILFNSAPETGFAWKLDAPLPEDALVQVEWRQMRTEKLKKLKELGLLNDDIPNSEEVTIATIRLKKAGDSKLRFICVRPGDDEPLLEESAEIEIRKKDEDEY